MKCSYCEARINPDIDTYFTCLDNFLQVKYFDSEEENVFCCRDCFCNYVMLDEVSPEDNEEVEDEIN